MLRVIGRRLASGCLTLLLVTVLVFLLIQLAPGSPLAESSDGEGLQRPDPAALAALRELYRLDQPLHRQYLAWLGDLLRGDLGRSFHDRRPVSQRILERLPVTLTLNLLALTLVVAISLPLGALAARAPDSLFDRASGVTSTLLFAVPAFWAGLLLQLLFSVRLGWFPLAGLASPDWEALSGWTRWSDRAAHLVLPVICLSYGAVAYLSRFVRANLLEEAADEGVLAARARGLGPLAVLLRHGMRRAALPLLTLAGFLFPGLVSGSVVVETVFAIPGLGRLFVEAAFQRDTPLLMGLTLLSGVATLFGVVLADLAYALADPRVRRG